MTLRLVIFILRRTLGMSLALVVGGLFGPSRAGRRVLRSFGLLRRLLRI